MKILFQDAASSIIEDNIEYYISFPSKGYAQIQFIDPDNLKLQVYTITLSTIKKNSEDWLSFNEIPSNVKIYLEKFIKLLVFI